MILSARYMLEGQDIDRKECRYYIENSGIFNDGGVPKIVTDSLVLSDTAPFVNPSRRI